MCGRFSLFTLSDVLARRFGLEQVPVYVPRYNIAPTSDVVTIRPSGQVNTGAEGGSGNRGAWEAVWMHWGVQPGSAGPLVINARSESLHERPMFREAVASRRCIVPADGFFEWRRAAGGKTPYWFAAEHAPFGLAAIWSPRGEDKKRTEKTEKEGGKIEGDVVIVTTDSNPLVAQVHDRMPVILRKEDEAKWLDPATQEEELVRVMQPLPERLMDCREVPKEANDAKNEGPQLIRPSPQRRLF